MHAEQPPGPGERAATEGEKCVDCGRIFRPGQPGLRTRPGLGPFITCTDRAGCRAERVRTTAMVHGLMSPQECLRAIEPLVLPVPDFPEPGVLFRDITPLLADGDALRICLNLMQAEADDMLPDLILGTESRGFVFAVPLADRLGAGFLPARKPGKLPGKVVRQAYGKEYGKDALELSVHTDLTGKRVVVVDDLLATGGTAAAAEALVGQLGGQVVGFVFLVELESFNGRRVLGWGKPPGEIPVRSILRYP